MNVGVSAKIKMAEVLVKIAICGILVRVIVSVMKPVNLMNI